MLLGLLPLFIHTGRSLTLQPVLIATATCTIKGLILPKMLLRAMSEVWIKREIEPLVGYSLSILLGLLALGVSALLGFTMPLPGTGDSPLLLPVSIFTILVGLFLIMTRRKALTQVIGYLVFENGIFVFGVSLIAEQPLLVEMGILLDLLVGVFIMGVIVFHIQREFDDIDVYVFDSEEGTKQRNDIRAVHGEHS